MGRRRYPGGRRDARSRSRNACRSSGPGDLGEQLRAQRRGQRPRVRYRRCGHHCEPSRGARDRRLGGGGPGCSVEERDDRGLRPGGGIRRRTRATAPRDRRGRPVAAPLGPERELPGRRQRRARRCTLRPGRVRAPGASSVLGCGRHGTRSRRSRRRRPRPGRRRL